MYMYSTWQSGRPIKKEISKQGSANIKNVGNASVCFEIQKKEHISVIDTTLNLEMEVGRQILS